MSNVSYAKSRSKKKASHVGGEGENLVPNTWTLDGEGVPQTPQQTITCPDSTQPSILRGTAK